MLNITDGKIKRPQKVVIYGSEGIGKSTFAAQFPKPLFIDTEGGTSHMNVRRINIQHTFRIHGRAMKEIEKILKDESKCD